MLLQRLAERHLFYILVERHAMYNTIFRINNSRQGYGNRSQTLKFFLVADKKLIDMGNDTIQQWRVIF